MISGHVAAIERAVKLADERGAKRAKVLPVSAPFHCSLMKPAQERLAVVLASVQFAPPRFPVVCNVDARPVEDARKRARSSGASGDGSVRWSESMQWLISQGVETFVEVGPGKVLCGLMRQIDRSKKCVNVEDEASLQKTLAFLTSVPLRNKEDPMAIDVRGMTPLLQVYDMPTSIQFYCEALGFEIVTTDGKPAPNCDWVLLRLNGVELMLNTAYEAPIVRRRPDRETNCSSSGHGLVFRMSRRGCGVQPSSQFGSTSKRAEGGAVRDEAAICDRSRRLRALLPMARGRGERRASLLGHPAPPIAAIDFLARREMQGLVGSFHPDIGVLRASIDGHLHNHAAPARKRAVHRVRLDGPPLAGRAPLNLPKC